METKKRQKVNYLNNADMLIEIHKSKISFCEIIDQKYSEFDVIVENINKITEAVAEEGRMLRVKRINANIIRETQKKYNCTPKKAMEYITEDGLLKLEYVKTEDVVFRVMNDFWIPQDTVKSHLKKRTNFKPFQQFIIKDNRVIEVVRSHWNGDFDNGCFQANRGRLTENLGAMIIELCERTSNKSNFRGYTYIDEMVGDAKLQLSLNALNFDESRETVQLNPFAYFTTIVHNAFRAVLNTEKRNRNIRDDLLVENGMDPSNTRMSEIESQTIATRLEEPKTTMSDNSLWD